MPFGVDVNQTQNGNMLPIVLSITCNTLSTGYVAMAAEKWLLTGMPTLPRGGAAYFATSTSGVGIAHLRSAICKGFFNTLFAQGKQTFGEACEGGRLNVYNMYSSTSEYRGFTTCGDPAMRIWTGIPRPLEVYHDSALILEAESLRVSVLCQDSPVESALVCVLLDTLVYEYGYTQSNGEIVFDFDTLAQGYLQVTVTAQNKIPYIDSISVGLTHVEEGTGPAANQLSGIHAYPNPFSKLITVSFGIEHGAERIGLDIYDASGRLVKYFSLPNFNLSSSTSVVWDGTDNAGKRLPAGVYFVRASSGREERSIPVVLLE